MNTHDFALTLAESLLRTEFSTDSEAPSSRGKRPRQESVPFTIAIGREVGASGTTVAHEVSKRLGWPVYDKEIIDKVAEEMGKPSTYVRGVDERHFNWLEECMAGMLAEYHVSPAAYLKQLICTIRGLGAKGNCVIVGRGANFILQPETTLRVRLVAERKDRTMVIGRRRGISDREAIRWIEETERTRVLFIKGNFGKDPADPLNYDLILNTSRLTPEECAETIVHTLHAVMARREAQRADEAKPAHEVAGMVNH